MASCPSCGQPVEPNARFCPWCGAPLAVPDEERRVVTVLFADLVGFTGLAERMDPEKVKHFVDRTFERLAVDITSFGGVVDKVLGDGILALFGAPVAHEDDAERAVRAALRMHETIATLSAESRGWRPQVAMRIGINTGEVLVGTTTAGGDYTAMGDVVNAASRLQSLAQQGQTLVGATTQAATGDAISYTPVGSLPARGRDEPIEAYVAVRAERLPGLHPQRGPVFVGRRHELELLEAQGRLAVDGSRAQLAMVVGEAGIGKTRLVSEASGFLALTYDARVLEGRCLPYGEANVWWPIADLVRNLFGLALDAPAADTELHLRASLLSHLTEATPETIERSTTALLHALGYDTPLRGGDRNRNRSEVMLAVTTVLERELAERPVVLVLSDMHWAAPAVWGLIGHVLTELARHRLSVFMTTRPDHEDQLPSGRHGLTVLQLGPLGDDAAARLLAELRPELEPSITAELVDRSGGNPYFLEELAGLVETRAGVVTAGPDGVDRDALPATLRGIVSARLDALEPGQRALLEDASVLGRTGPVSGLMTLARESRGATGLDAELDGLVDAELLELDGARYRFRSNVVCDVAYGRLTKTVRAQRHHGIASYLSDQDESTLRNSVVVAIAEHYRWAAHLMLELSEVPGLDLDSVLSQALYWLEQAGERALDVGEPREALRWFDAGVELGDGDDDVLATMVFGRAKARTEIHELAAARADLDRLAAMSSLDPLVAAKAQLVLGDLERKAGDHAAAVVELASAAERLAALDAPDQEALALRLMGISEMMRNDDAAARAAFARSRQVAEQASDPRAEGWALQSLAWHAFRLGRVTEANVLVDEAVELFGSVDDQGALVWAHGVQAWVAFHTGDWEEARRLVDSVLPETRRRGDPWAEGIMANLDATLRLWSGQASEAFDLARSARAAAEGTDDVTLAVLSRTIEGRALVSLGRINEGTKALEDAFARSVQAGDAESMRMAVVVNCASAARLGEPERAIRWAARHEEGFSDQTIVGEPDLVVSLALALLQRGAVPEAASQLGWDDETPRRGSFASAVGSLVAAAEGDQAQAQHLVDETLKGPATYLDRVFALIAQAAVALQRGDHDECESALVRAGEQLAATDDLTSRQLVDLAGAVFGRVPRTEAESSMRNIGMDPRGWTTALELVADPIITPRLAQVGEGAVADLGADGE
ncbi:MAG: adenylate/guanylate cyclase domain-containing protein [Actinomycetota bacterium]